MPPDKPPASGRPRIAAEDRPTLGRAVRVIAVTSLAAILIGLVAVLFEWLETIGDRTNAFLTGESGTISGPWTGPARRLVFVSMPVIIWLQRRFFPGTEGTNPPGDRRDPDRPVASRAGSCSRSDRPRQDPPPRHRPRRRRHRRPRAPRSTSVPACLCAKMCRVPSCCCTGTHPRRRCRQHRRHIQHPGRGSDLLHRGGRSDLRSPACRRSSGRSPSPASSASSASRTTCSTAGRTGRIMPIACRAACRSATDRLLDPAGGTGDRDRRRAAGRGVRADGGRGESPTRSGAMKSVRTGVLLGLGLAIVGIVSGGTSYGGGHARTLEMLEIAGRTGEVSSGWADPIATAGASLIALVTEFPAASSIRASRSARARPGHPRLVRRIPRPGDRTVRGDAPLDGSLLRRRRPKPAHGGGDPLRDDRWYGMILPIMLAAMLASIVAGRLCEPSSTTPRGQFLDRLGLGDRTVRAFSRARGRCSRRAPSRSPEELPTLLDK